MKKIKFIPYLIVFSILIISIASCSPKSIPEAEIKNVNLDEYYESLPLKYKEMKLNGIYQLTLYDDLYSGYIDCEGMYEDKYEAKKYISQTADTQKTLLLNNTIISLDYVESYFCTENLFPSNMYKNEEYGVTVYYSDINDNIFSISFGNLQPKILTDNLNDKAAVQRACYEYLTAHTENLNLEAYTPQVIQNETYYSVVYTKFVSGLQTNDFIRLNVGFDGNLQYIVFSQKYVYGNFRDEDKQHLDIILEEAAKPVADFLTREIIEYKDELGLEEDGPATYEGYELKNELSLMYSNGMICIDFCGELLFEPFGIKVPLNAIIAIKDCRDKISVPNVIFMP